MNMRPSHPLPEVASLVPHRAPMLLLDRVVALGDDHAVCEVVLRDDSSFVEDGVVDAIVAIEYMAQTIAAHVGYQGRLRGLPVRIGYLVGVREATFEVARFEVGDVLVVTARRGYGDDSLGVFECEVARDGQIVARASLSVVRPEDGNSEGA